MFRLIREYFASMSGYPGPITVFEFGWRYECIKSLGHRKHQKILQADRSFVFCFMFSPDKYALI